MKKAFTLVEILIVVVILAILAALVLPMFRSHAAEAKEAAAKDNLRILRQAIELYAALHEGVPPGYYNNDSTQTASSDYFFEHLSQSGQYMLTPPKNPFNGKDTVQVIQNNADFPANATDNYGWIYKPQTKDIRIDSPGTDSQGVSYFNY